MTDLYDAIPKVELHCHVEGTVRPTTEPADKRAMRTDFEAVLEGLRPGDATA